MQKNSKEPVYAGFLLIMVTWPSGKARVCKTLIRQFKSARHLHKTVMKRCHSLFLLYRRKSAISPTNFRHGYSVVQPFSGGFPTLIPTISAAFWNSAGEGTIFLRKNRIISAAFRRFSIFPQPISHWLRGFFAFSDSFQFFFKFPILYLYIK